MSRSLKAIIGSQQFGLILVIVVLGGLLTAFAGSHLDKSTGKVVNDFLNAQTLFQLLTDTSIFAIMAVGMTMVIITAGIDLSVGSIYALAGVTMGLLLRNNLGIGPEGVLIGFAVCAGVGLLAGSINGALITGLGVHPFIITLGTMWAFRGVAFVTSKAVSIPMPRSLIEFAKNNLGLTVGLNPVPPIIMVLVTIAGSIFLTRTVTGRRVFAIGGNTTAALYSGVRINWVLIGVYAITGLVAGISAFVAGAFYGATNSGDAQGYELYVIASAVVGGASLAGGKGSAFSAMLGALLIMLMRKAIVIMRFDQNYEAIIIGCAIIIAVVLDRLSARLAVKRIAAGRA